MGDSRRDLRAASGRRRRLLLASLLLLSLLAAPLVLEGGLRLGHPQPLEGAVTETVDGVIGLRPSARVRFSAGEYSVLAATNPQRFRSRHEHPLRARRRMRRIATLGDEWTFGTSVGDWKTWPTLLEGVLNEHAANVEVLNAGAPGTSTGNQALWYQRWVKRFEPDLVILAISANDLAELAQQPRFALRPDGVAEPLPTPELVRLGLPDPAAGGLLRGLPGLAQLEPHSHLVRWLRGPEPRPTEPTLDAEAAIELLMAEVRWLRERVLESGADLAVGYIPERAHFDREQQSSPSVQSARALLARLEAERAERGLRFTSMEGFLRRYMGRTERSVFFEDSGQLNEQGHQEIARTVARELAAHFKKNRQL